MRIPRDFSGPTVKQHWEENQSNYVLCAGYEDRFRGKGVCIELAVTGVVQAVDGGDGINAGLRVASDVRWITKRCHF